MASGVCKVYEQDTREQIEDRLAAIMTRETMSKHKKNNGTRRALIYYEQKLRAGTCEITHKKKRRPALIYLQAEHVRPTCLLSLSFECEKLLNS